jgi:predicted HTH domain antitoxin
VAAYFFDSSAVVKRYVREIGTAWGLSITAPTAGHFTNLVKQPTIGGRMSLTVAIEIPQEVLHAARMTPEEMKRELAVLLFQQGKLSFGKAREMAGMTVWALQQLLGSRGITVHYDVADYEEDLATLKALGRL